MRTRIKICGLTTIEDALSSAQLGADALGLNFYPKSSRYLSLDAARAIRSAVPPFVSVVALFVDPGRSEVEQALKAISPALLQFHGDEPAEFCRSFGLPYVKACRMAAEVDLLEYMRPYADAQAWLADGYSEQYGGAGTQFDWSRLPKRLAKPLILSGGLNPQNAREAVHRVRPWALDVCSGVESGKGIKDAAKVAAFIAEVKHADG